ARRTTGAGGEVDDHAPLELAIEEFGSGEVEGEALLFFADRGGKLLSVAVAGLKARTLRAPFFRARLRPAVHIVFVDDVAALGDDAMLLSGDQVNAGAELVDRAMHCLVHCSGSTQSEDIGAAAVGDAAD